MASRKQLLEITYHDDDDTGMYQVGEIDFGICGILDDYLKRYGYAGKKDIIDTLGYLIYEVENDTLVSLHKIIVNGLSFQQAQTLKGKEVVVLDLTQVGKNYVCSKLKIK